MENKMPSVVIADDEEFVRYFLKTILEDMGYDVVAEVEKGDELYNVMSDQTPDILFLDINMPNLTGKEFLQKYAFTFRKTCIIVLTSNAQDLTRVFSETNVSRILRKDTPMEEMISAIKMAWEDFQRGIIR